MISDSVAEPRPTVAELIKAPLKTMSDDAALDVVATLIDQCGDEQSLPGVQQALRILATITRRKLTPPHRSMVHFFRANALHVKRIIEGAASDADWEQPDQQAQILELFSARNHPGFNDLDEGFRCKILTNLASQLSHVGRVIESIQILDDALAIMPNFAMAHGGRGASLKAYAAVSEDPYDQEVLILEASKAFAASTARGALWDSGLQPTVKAYFQSEASAIARRFELEAIARDLDLEGHTLGRSREEQDYRRWALRHRLFLNPFNDLGPYPIAAVDQLMLPSITVGWEVKGMPSVIGLYNQMKQEFAFARLMLFESERTDSVHYADRKVRLSNTLDYPSFSMEVEKARTSFRLAYSLLDKVGYFISCYWNLGTPAHKVGFRSAWYEDGDSKLAVLHPAFHGYANAPLLGLFWLSKDLFDERFRKVTNPDAREAFIIRNHLEHKYLQVHESWAAGGRSDLITGDIGYSIGGDEFQDKALRLLKTARAALIYLSLAVHVEERARRKKSTATMVASMPLTTFDDDWKR